MLIDITTVLTKQNCMNADCYKYENCTKLFCERSYDIINNVIKNHFKFVNKYSIQKLHIYFTRFVKIGNVSSSIS